MSLKSLKSLLGYIGCLAVAVLLAYYITGTGGLFIVVLIIVALILDLVLSVVSSRKLSINLSTDCEIANKGEKVKVKITPDNGTILPSGIIRVEIACSGNLSLQEEGIYRFVTAGNNPQSVEISLSADFCGMGEIFVKSLTVSDFLGIYDRKISCESCSQVKIMPPIPDAGTQGEVIKTVTDNINFDDSEEESEEQSLIPTGIPGYDHRPYVPGDSLKRINWKISSKRGNLMVRLDEKSTGSSQIFYLDFPQTTDKIITKEYCRNADRIICGSLAMLSMLLKQGFESEYILFCDGIWENIEIRDEKGLEYLQEKLAGITPVPSEKRFPPKDLNKKDKSVICFSTITNEMMPLVKSLAERMNGAVAVTAESGITKIPGIDIWTCDNDYNFKKL